MADSGVELGRSPVGRRVFLGLMGLGVLGFSGLAKLTGDAVVHYNNVSTMPFNGAEPSGPITNSVFRGPERFRYYSVAPVPKFDRATWKITVGGLVDRPFAIDYGSLFSLDSVIVNADFHCVTGWTVHGLRWQGLQVRRLLEMAGVQAAGRYVAFTSFDGIYKECYSLEQASRDHCIVAFKLNGTPLEQRQGAPARLIQPDFYGYKSLKWLTGIRVVANREQGYWEQKGWCNPAIGDDSVDDCPPAR